MQRRITIKPITYFYSMDDNAKTASTFGPIVFMGTPVFAVASLDALLNAGYTVAAVVTAPDKPAGRGMKLTESAVKKFAVEKGLPVLQPDKLKNELFIQQLKALQAGIQVVVAFRMLPEIVWNMPPMGTINLHGSLLPQYRGAAPINWAVINGERETGVTTFKLQHEIDTGNILLQESFPIGEEETAGDVHDKMKEIGAALLVKTIDGLAAGTLTEQPQSQLHPPDKDGTVVSSGTPLLRHAPRIFTETCKIDWNKPVEEVYNLVRGLSPFPTAFTFLHDKMLKIFFGKKEIVTPSVAVGECITDHKTYLKFAAIDGYLSITELQLEGKKKMRVDEFLKGYRF